MVNIKEFKFNTKQELKYYVYALTYKENNEEVIFYIGKGKGDRVFAHFDDANKLKEEGLEEALSGKHRKILDKECFAYIVKAGLKDQDEAFKYEALLIDLLWDFKSIDLQNKVKGHDEWGKSRVELVDARYSKPIDLEEYCQKNNLSILGFKIDVDSYNSGLYKDHRAILEGRWTIDQKRIETVDYVVALHQGLIYGVYKYVKKSIRKTSSFTQEEWDKWNLEHHKMGRPEKYTFGTDKYLSDMDKRSISRSVFQLEQVAVQPTQSIKVDERKLTDQDLKVGKDIFNKNIVNGKTKTQNPVVYYGNKKEA